LRPRVARSDRFFQKGVDRDRRRVFLFAERAEHAHVCGIGDCYDPRRRPFLPHRLREALRKKAGRRIMRLIVEEQPARRVGQSDMRLRREPGLSRDFRAERVCIKMRRDRPGRHDPRHVDPCPIERDHTSDRIKRHASAFQPIRIGRDKRREMDPRTMPDENDPARIDIERPAMFHEPAQGTRNVGELILNLDIGHEAIVERGIGIALRYEIARLPALTVLF